MEPAGWGGWKLGSGEMTWVRKHGPWAVLALIGAVALSVVATARGENVNALWILVAALSVYLVAYRYYSLYIAKNVMRLDGSRLTPAVTRNDGLDYVPTNKNVLFGHHFAYAQFVDALVVAAARQFITDARGHGWAKVRHDQRLFNLVQLIGIKL